MDIEEIKSNLFQQNITLFSWSRETNATLKVLAEMKSENTTQVFFTYKNNNYSISIPFTDKASLDNAITCICTLFLLEIPFETIQERISQLQPLEMRLQLKKGINNCHVLNDSYSNDLSSLSIALDYLQQQAGNNPTTVIISDIPQSGMHEEVLYHVVANELEQRNIHRLIGIGKSITEHQAVFDESVPERSFYLTTDDFLNEYTGKSLAERKFQNEYILLKGARIFSFERINNWLEFTT